MGLVSMWSDVSDRATVPISSLPKPIAPVVSAAETNALTVSWSPPLNHSTRSNRILRH